MSCAKFKRKPYNPAFVVLMLNEENNKCVVLCDPRQKYKKYEIIDGLGGNWEDVPEEEIICLKI